MEKYEYVGCFFDYEELSQKVSHLRKIPLEFEKSKPHVTFEYNPCSVDTNLFGTEIHATIIGYGNNGENEGVLVILNSSNEVINKMVQKIELPHITLAISKEGKAVNTKFLTFDSVNPVYINGFYGGHIEN